MKKNSAPPSLNKTKKKKKYNDPDDVDSALENLDAILNGSHVKETLYGKSVASIAKLNGSSVKEQEQEADEGERDDDDDEDEGRLDEVLDSEVKSADEWLRKVTNPKRTGSPVKMVVNLANVVIKAELTLAPLGTEPKRNRVDLMYIMKHACRMGFRFNKTTFPGLLISVDEPKSALTIFGSGKVSSSGCHSLREAILAIDRNIENVRACMPSGSPYRNLRAFNARVSNIVCRVPLEYTVKCAEIRRDYPHTTEKYIENSIGITPPVLPGTGNNRKGSQRLAGSTVVHEGGFLVINGCISLREISHAAHFVECIVSRYKGCDAMHGFSTRQLRRYRKSLIVACKEGLEHPDQFIALCADGSIGTMKDWIEEYKPHEKIELYAQMLRNPEKFNNTAGMRHGRTKHAPILTDNEEKARQNSGHLNSNKELIAIFGERALARPWKNESLIALSNNNNLKNVVLRTTHAEHRAKQIEKSQERAQNVMENGALQVLKNEKPKQTKLIPLSEAALLHRTKD